jgi:hypothetical protein
MILNEEEEEIEDEEEEEDVSFEDEEDENSEEEEDDGPGLDYLIQTPSGSESEDEGWEPQQDRKRKAS